MKLTHEQLNRKIADLRETEPDADLYITDVANGGLSGDGEWIGKNWKWEPRHNYLSDANAMLELLAEMPAPLLWRRNDTGHWGIWSESRKSYPTSPQFAHREICIAVAICWYEMKTGEVVELEEKEDGGTK